LGEVWAPPTPTPPTAWRPSHAVSWAAGRRGAGAPPSEASSSIVARESVGLAESRKRAIAAIISRLAAS